VAIEQIAETATMAEIPTLDQQRQFYDKWNAENRAVEFDGISNEVRARAERILNYLSRLDDAPRNILEVGCGTGWLSRRLGEHGAVTAIDLSPKAIELAASRDPRGNYIAGDFFEQRFETSPFEVVVCVETLFYVDDQEGFVDKLAELCADGGLLAVTTVNKYVYARSRDVGPPEEGQVRNWLSRRQTLNLLRRRFNILESFTVEPRGDKGVLQLVNSVKLNNLASKVVSRDRIKRIKERFGFGGGFVVFARKRTGAKPE
jgi:2-polyprenyl-3-methyl-5-hydroxy-6-metoxy-1,4-benzoquinol methylase